MVFLFTILPILIFVAVLHFLKQPLTLDVVLFIVLAIFMSSITTALDMDFYKIGFSHPYFENSVNWGFKTIEKFFSNKGMSFYEFYFVYHIWCVTIVFLSIRLVFNDSFKCILLYIISPFIFNVMQLKNFGMMAIMLLAFSICYRCKNKKLKTIVWIVLIIIASSLHVAGFAYLPFIFLLGNRKILDKLPVIMFVTTSFFIFASSYVLSSLLQPILALTVDDAYRAARYTERHSSFGGFFFMFISLTMIFIANQVRTMYRLYRFFYVDKLFLGENNVSFPEQIYDFTLYSTLFWPLFVATAHYSRLIENQLVLIYILVVSSFSMYRRLSNKINRIFLDDMFIKILISFFLLMAIYVYSQWILRIDDVVIGIFSNLKIFYAFTS